MSASTGSSDGIGAGGGNHPRRRDRDPDSGFPGLRRKARWLFAAILALGLGAFILPCGCDFAEYSPYDVEIDSDDADIIRRSIERVGSLRPASPDSFVIAFLTDTHSRYDDFRDAIRSINKRPEVLFIIHGGDITDQGLLKEYAWAEEIIDDCRVPFLPVIGNHDCLSNGTRIYSELFGPTYYSFDLALHDGGSVRFIMLNDNSLEFSVQHSRVEAFRSWCDSVFTTGGSCRGIVAVAHVPPSDPDYFDESEAEDFQSQLAESGVSLALFGHEHRHSSGEYPGGVRYLVRDDIRDRRYYLITLYTQHGISVNVTPCRF